MENINWEEAPEWADRVVVGRASGTLYWAEANKRVSFGGWSDFHDDIHVTACWEVVATRPIEWDGNGIPPVGVVCEALWNAGANKWLKVKVFGVNEQGQPILRWEEGPQKYEYQAAPLTGRMGKPYFRPIRSPQQLAAEIADKEIKEIAGIICADGAFDMDDPELMAAATALYDAGYRRLEPSK